VYYPLLLLSNNNRLQFNLIIHSLPLFLSKTRMAIRPLYQQRFLRYSLKLVYPNNNNNNLLLLLNLLNLLNKIRLKLGIVKFKLYWLYS